MNIIHQSYMKSFSFSLLFVSLFFLFITPASAFALTISNVAFDHSTGNYSFNYSGYTQGDITGESIEFRADDGQWQYNHEPASCSGGSTGSGSCSGTVNYDHSVGSFNCGAMRIGFYGYNPGFPNQTGILNTDPDCIQITNLSFDHSTGNYSFDYTGYTKGNISGESIEFKADDGQWQYNHEPASCSGGSTGSGSCSGTVNYNHSIGSFNCGTMQIGFYGYNPGFPNQQGLINPDPSC
jgi:hypothetical protein